MAVPLGAELLEPAQDQKQGCECNQRGRLLLDPNKGSLCLGWVCTSSVCLCYLPISNLCRTSEGRVKSSTRGMRLADLNILHLHWCRSLRQKSYKLTFRVLLHICAKMYIILNLKHCHCLCTAVQKSNQELLSYSITAISRCAGTPLGLHVGPW